MRKHACKVVTLTHKKSRNVHSNCDFNNQYGNTLLNLVFDSQDDPEIWIGFWDMESETLYLAQFETCSNRLSSEFMICLLSTWVV